MMDGHLHSISYRLSDCKNEGHMSPMSGLPDNTNLPAIVSLEIARTRYDPPRRRYVGRELVQEREGIELMVRTATPLPVGAISLVLFIGEVVVSEYETAGPNLYRFFVFDFKHLLRGAPIAL